MLKITFDSNAWERTFDPDWEKDKDRASIATIREALKAGLIAGFICETPFRLETLKRARVALIAGSEFAALSIKMQPGIDGSVNLTMTMGAADRRHPGLHQKQAAKLNSAFAHGVKLIDGTAWLGLAGPNIEGWRTHVVPLPGELRAETETRNIEVFYALHDDGVGKSMIDKRIEALERASGLAPNNGGWKILDEVTDGRERAKVVAEISEWADAEIIAAHYGHQHDYLCTEDHARNAGRSAFDAKSKQMLTDRFSIRFCDLAKLSDLVRA